MPIYSAPILNVDLPKPIVLTSSQLTGLYALMLGIDYVLLRHQDKLVISKSTLRLGLTVTHAIVPLAVVSPYLPNNVAFAAVPWFIAAYSAYLPTEEFTLTEWLRALYNTVVDHPLMTSDKDNRTLGLKKVFRGVGKLTFLYFVIEPLLPAKPDDMLKYAWLSKESLLSTFLFGLKAYLILGGMDVLMGFVQCFSGWCMQDMFDSPILSTR
ncbi:hypothetical protein BDF20DRAFT_186956 [Mycotypha africana]|uniref:uncharacterized protein n=1 Tax=Mycotypha africana TaxID=64632 RepID=UPI00230037DB|nr:uncharacterized protein BDF20DRAFT_186956 [Mycotypha africana]KAI8968536.1 hypothetical protein BDF20DRAFT_186956 [Mycotypha africana]